MGKLKIFTIFVRLKYLLKGNLSKEFKLYFRYLFDFELVAFGSKHQDYILVLRFTALEKDIDDKNNDKLQWFAMRATYRRELSIQDMLEATSIQCYIPMQYKLKLSRNGKRIRVLEPVLHNLIFVHCSKSFIQEFKTKIPYLQYMTKREDGKNVPIVVPDSQMNDFISVTSNHDESLIYLKPEELNVAKGTKVRIHGGAFDGVEGLFVKVEGKRNKRVVIEIQNVISVALATISSNFIEIIK